MPYSIETGMTASSACECIAIWCSITIWRFQFFIFVILSNLIQMPKCIHIQSDDNESILCRRQQLPWHLNLPYSHICLRFRINIHFRFHSRQSPSSHDKKRQNKIASNGIAFLCENLFDWRSSFTWRWPSTIDSREEIVNSKQVNEQVYSKVPFRSAASACYLLNVPIHDSCRSSNWQRPECQSNSIESDAQPNNKTILSNRLCQFVRQMQSNEMAILFKFIAQLYRCHFHLIIFSVMFNGLSTIR